MSQTEFREQIKVQGEHLAQKVKELIHEGNVRHIVIRHGDHTVMEIKVTPTGQTNEWSVGNMRFVGGDAPLGA